MPQTRMAVEATEILHLEVECLRCHAVTMVPLNTPLPEQADAFPACPWCAAKWDVLQVRSLRSLHKALLWFRTDKPLPLRFVFPRHGSGNRE